MSGTPQRSRGHPCKFTRRQTMGRESIDPRLFKTPTGALPRPASRIADTICGIPRGQAEGVATAAFPLARVLPSPVLTSPVLENPSSAEGR